MTGQAFRGEVGPPGSSLCYPANKALEFVNYAVLKEYGRDLAAARRHNRAMIWELNFDLQANSDTVVNLDPPAKIFEANDDGKRDGLYFALPAFVGGNGQSVMANAIHPLMPFPLKYRMLNSTTRPHL